MHTYNFIYSLFSICMLGLVSCSSDETESLRTSPNNEISFICYTAKTSSRAATTTSTSFDAFGVLASWTKTSVWSATAQNQRTPNFMYNQGVTKSVTAWQYNPSKYWPGNGDKVSFFAYAPYTTSPAALATGSSGVIALSGKDVSGEPWLKFEVGSDIGKHQDLMYAKAMDRSSTNGEVNLEFKHALSQVFFKAVAWEPDGDLGDSGTTVTINSVSLKTKRKSATLNISSGAWSSPVDDSNQITYALTTDNGHLKNNVFTGGSSVTNRLMADNDYIMMLPNLGTDVSDQYTITVDYTVNDEQKTISQTIAPNFAAGKCYAITIHLGIEADDYIHFTATCGGWGTGSDVSVSLGG